MHVLETASSLKHGHNNVWDRSPNRPWGTDNLLSYARFCKGNLADSDGRMDRPDRIVTDEGTGRQGKQYRLRWNCRTNLSAPGNITLAMTSAGRHRRDKSRAQHTGQHHHHAGTSPTLQS